MVDNLEQNLNDQTIIMKLAITESLITAYQKDFPSKTSIEGLNKLLKQMTDETNDYIKNAK